MTRSGSARSARRLIGSARIWLVISTMVFGVPSAIVLTTVSVDTPSAAAVQGPPVNVLRRHVRALASALNIIHREMGLEPTVDLNKLTANWRFELEPVFAALPQFRRDVAIHRPLHGRIVAGTLVLPASVTLNGNTTIIARRVVFTGRPVKIITNGHDLHVYPIDAFDTSGGDATDDEPFDRGPSLSMFEDDVTVDTSGTDGSAGGVGCMGSPTYQSGRAPDGANGTGVVGCDGAPGGNGEAGSLGYEGGDGDNGTDGNSAGNITFDVPDGATATYRFIANGGKGGKGGDGGLGGYGGHAGHGGDGADGEGNDSCSVSNGGNGGNGGKGGDGGRGGRGGDGGVGGCTANISVSYPAGFSGQIHTSTNYGGGGEKGAGGQGGFGGFYGYGGRGGAAPGNGYSGEPGQDGANGEDGASSTGTEGNPGLGGSSWCGEYANNVWQR